MPDAPPNLVAVCTPGWEFSAQWVSAWTSFLFQFLQGHSICHTQAMSNNIYFLRDRCISEIRKTLGSTIPDYLLWIDSDNIFEFAQFLLLKQALIDHPEASGIGAWYYIHSGIPQGAEIAAGWHPNGGDVHLGISQINDTSELIEVDYIGFGFLLMRGSLLLDMDDHPFAPLPNGEAYFPDDASFTMRMKQKGHRFFVHPKVHVQHLKTLPLVANPNA